MFITFSLVTYKTSKEDFDGVVNSIKNVTIPYKLIVSDNSPTDEIKTWCENEKNILYIYNNENGGYGKGHNKAIYEAQKLNPTYHFVVNPDITFNSGNIETMVNFMDAHPKVGLSMPKILCENGDIQYVAKSVPTPACIFLRGALNKVGFIANSRMMNRINTDFEMRYADFNKDVFVPIVSGCFMCFRTSVFNDVGYFDDRFFMYFEDFDISRRVCQKYDTVLVAGASVTHRWERGARKSKALKKIATRSAIKYFNKHGWLFDKFRRNMNKRLRETKALYLG